jgi:hypothetical protein
MTKSRKSRSMNIIKREMVIGCRMRRRELSGRVRNMSDDDVANGGMYRKLPKKVKASYTLT